ncbi:NAD-dependent deacylase [Emticicia sp. CRIBPO]|uniref:SIR2 family NAD-dependent protein deacylase n=1 Tax=Emticicia sp. CRIBPO TaxID=2683258 RepID=UPI0014129988|nr:NAD-dependent deacylase [Emticicia sp. CRIBPO]NBA84470.1 NAD-dependent deacylase [Emticicia sp. CRIBPO]
MKRIVVLTGAGISAESGLRTFRDSGGLWENYAIEDVATPEGWAKNPELVLEFYNQRRKSAMEALPNAGHLALVELEQYFDVTIITQNVDGLHEKAGSLEVIHLHGELSKVRSVKNPLLISDIGGDSIHLGDLAEDGGQLRPHIVWFGEMVPLIETAAAICSEADIFIVVGTSMQVYPAAGLIQYVPMDAPKFIVDPVIPDMSFKYKKMTYITDTATAGLPPLARRLISEYA